MDLIVRNARLRDTPLPQDIGIRNGRIEKIAPWIDSAGLREIDAEGRLTVPPFCDPHLHLDAALAAGKPRHNLSGTLIEGMALWGELKKDLDKDTIVSNAVRAVMWEFAHGVQYIRTHVDTSAPGLVTVKALLEVREKVRELVDIQIVAFPQDGVYTEPDAAGAMERAMEMGADVVGGIPHNELTREDGVRSVEYAFSLAQRFGARIDIHCDETGDEQSRFLEVALKNAIVSGMGSKVTASHTTAMHNYGNDYALKLIGIAARSRVNFITNPFDNSVLQNRRDGYPRRRGHTRVDELDAAGVNVCIGHDSIMDPWYPMGTGSMLQAANLLLHTAHMSGRSQIVRLFDMIGVNSAVTLGVEERYGLENGKPANLIILDATSEFDAIRLQSECVYAVRNGRVVLETTPAKRVLRHAGYETEIAFTLPTSPPDNPTTKQEETP